MDDFPAIPKDDFMYDRVDFNFLVDINMLLHFVTLASKRLGKTSYINCEVFLVLKHLINNNLPHLNEKIVSTEQSQKDLNELFGKTRAKLCETVEKELKKTFEEQKKPKILTAHG